MRAAPAKSSARHLRASPAALDSNNLLVGPVACFFVLAHQAFDLLERRMT
jgi:hypothetical protein